MRAFSLDGSPGRTKLGTGSKSSIVFNNWLSIVDGVVKGHDWTDAGHEEYSMPLEQVLDLLDVD